MAMRGPLRRELNKYRKGRAGAMPGPPGRRHYVTGAVPSPVHGAYLADLYMWGVPRSYHPNMNARAAQSDEYLTDPEWESHRVPHSHQERLFLPFPESAVAEVPEPSPDYEDTKAFSEFFLKVMEAQYRPCAEGEEMPTSAQMWQQHFAQSNEPNLEPVDDTSAFSDIDALLDQPKEHLPDFGDVVESLGHPQNVFPEDHPDIVNLRTALYEMLEHPELLPQPEDFGVELTESKLGTGDPYAMDTIDDPEVPEIPYADDGPLGHYDVACAPESSMFDDMVDGPVPGLDEGFGLAVGDAVGLENILDAGVGESVNPGGLEQMIEQGEPFDAPAVEGMPQETMPDVSGIDMGSSDVMPEADSSIPMTPEDEINQAMDMAAGQPEMEQER